MEKVLLNKELSEKYSSQLEYMGHNNLLQMELSDGNWALEENGNFYIVFTSSLEEIAEIDSNLAFQLHTINNYNMYDLVDERA